MPPFQFQRVLFLVLIAHSLTLPCQAIDPRANTLCIQVEGECQEIGTRELALKKANEAIKIDPKAARCWRAKASVLSHMDENEEALKLVEKAIEIDPNSTANFALKAKILRAQNKGDEALRCINRALSLDDNYDNHLTKAQVLLQLKRLPEALSQTNLALKTKPNHLTMLDLKATIEARLGQWQNAVNTLSIIIPRADPKLYSTATHLANRATAYYQLKQYKAAEADAQVICKRYPLSREFRVLLIKIYQAKGDKEATAREQKALQDYDQDFTPIN